MKLAGEDGGAAMEIRASRGSEELGSVFPRPLQGGEASRAWVAWGRHWTGVRRGKYNWRWRRATELAGAHGSSVRC